jgi:hypothetical protein
VSKSSRLPNAIRRSALLLCAAAALGCGVQPQGGRITDRAPTGETGVFTPEAIRIHPLTRIVEPGEGSAMLIDAHVELFDAWGHPTKGLGSLRFELFLSGGGGIGAAPDGGIVRAQVDLTDPDINSTRYYDSATRTYRMLLEAPADAAAGTTMTLVATFVTTDNRRLRDEYTLGSRSTPRDPVEAPGPDENAPPDEARQGGG